ncbi:MAG TPA: fasciclin domain-containing protein [Acidimicrobiia bacterium]|nr:fasciclin domain-containing protein [Acidimicrobiia bacterium]
MRNTTRRTAVIAVLALAVSACGSDEISVEEAQAQFCADVEEYVTALDTYGGLFDDVELTVGDVRSAADDLDSAREAVGESAAVFRGAVEADPDTAVTIELLESDSITTVQEAEEDFDDSVAGINDRTQVVDAGVRFTSAAYALQVAWVRLFADAGCIEDEDEATEWVSGYVSALQTDLATIGLYGGRIDGIYGPETIAAVERLQDEAGLEVTGLPDPATQRTLAERLDQGESAQVAALQGILTATGHYTGPVDGVWSNAVEEALKALQSELGVPATGVVDAATMRVFEAALAEAGNPPAPEPTDPVPSAPPSTSGPATTEPAPATTAPPAPATTAPAPPTTAALPTTVPPVAGGILDVLADAGQFTQLLAAIDTAGLTETLSGGGPFTMFAPTDEAFAQLAESLPTEPEALQAVLLYHVVEDNLGAFDLIGLGSVTTSQGGTVAISVTGGQIVLNDVSTITISNVLGSNGVVHVVNAVLVPPA